MITIDRDKSFFAYRKDGKEVKGICEDTLFNLLEEMIENVKTDDDIKQEFIDEKLSEMTDEEVIQNDALVKEWKPRVDYTQNELIKHLGVIYRTIKGISGDMNVLPPNQMPSEFEDLTHKLPQDGSYPIWDEVTAVTYGYELGSIVQHNDKVWIATEGNADEKNTWEPGVYGWEVYDGV